MTATTELPAKTAGATGRGLVGAPLIKRFDEIGIDDIPLVGGKNASLGEMRRELTAKGVPVPDGFATTAAAYWHFLEKTELKALIDEFARRSRRRRYPRAAKAERENSRRDHLRQTCLRPRARDPECLRAAFCGERRDRCGAVRSSATAEDLPDASFAGAQETLPERAGRRGAARRRVCAASPRSFTDRAISYRADKGFAHTKIALSIGVQRMVRSDLAHFRRHVHASIPRRGFRDAVLINAAYGLGENVVKGSVNPDEYCVFKPTLKQGFRPILQKIIGTQGIQDDLRHWRRQDGEKRAGAASGSRALRDERRRHSPARALGLHHRRALHAKRGSPRRWTSNGRRTASRASCLSCRRGRRRCSRAKTRMSSSSTNLKQRGKVLVTGRSVGAKIAHRAGARD